MSHAIRYLAAVVGVLVSGCGGGSYYFIEWMLADTVTLAPGDSIPLPITVWRENHHLGEARVTFENLPPGVTLKPPEFSIPEGQDTVTVSPTLAIAADTSAHLQTVSKLQVVIEDATTDFTDTANVFLALVAPPVPQPDFSITGEPRQVNLVSGRLASVQVQIIVKRTGYTGPLTLRFDSTNPNIKVQPLTLFEGQTIGTFFFHAEAGKTRGPVVARVVATALDTRQASTGFTFNVR